MMPGDVPAQTKINPASATLTDLVRLAGLASSVSPQAHLQGEAQGLPCLPGSGRVRLYFDDSVAHHIGAGDAGAWGAARAPARSIASALPMSAAAKFANKTLAQVLINSRTQVANVIGASQDGSSVDRNDGSISGSSDKAPISRLLSQYARIVERSHRPQTAADFTHLMRVTSEALHQHVTAQLPPVPVQIAQTPTDCMLHWIAALQTASDAADGADTVWLQQVTCAARRRWMQHDLTLSSVRAYFAQMHIESVAQGVGGLAVVADKLAASLPTDQQAANFDTRLHDNLYGRVFETRLIARLIAAPPPGTLICAQTLSLALRDFFCALSPADQLMVAKKLSLLLAEKPRFWYDHVPKLLGLITAAAGRQKKQALETWLCTPVRSAYDCMGVMLFASELSLLLKQDAASSAPWMWPSDWNYAHAVQPSARRLQNMPALLLRAEGGITLQHQRSAYSQPTMRPSIRASLQHRPNLDTPSPVIRRMLDHGLPYASGVSGSTNILLHLAHYFKQAGIDLDYKQILLDAALLLGGGHSLHEVLWVGHQLDRLLGLNLAIGDVPPEEYVSDYDRFISLFDGADRQRIDHAVAAAWNDTIGHARSASL